MIMPRSERCRYCHRRLIFAYTVNNKLMPLDPVPNPAGNVAVYRDDRGDLIATVLSANRQKQPHEMLHMAHFATCPDRPAPKTKEVTAANAAQTARRKRRFEADPLPLELPENVLRFPGGDPG
jgi:hypothetical protein